MVARQNRRDQVIAAAVPVLVEGGTRGFTHRAVDQAAGVPLGTTSNFYPTRQALVLGVLEHLTEHDGDGLSLPEEPVGTDAVLAGLRGYLDNAHQASNALVWHRLLMEDVPMP